MANPLTLACTAVITVALLMSALAAALTPPGRNGTPPAHVDEIHPTLLDAYTRAATTLETLHPHCTGMRWSILAGIGAIESNHAAGRTVPPSGDVTPPIIGPRLDGSGVGGNLTPHHDTDNGRLDRDTAYDRAVGPAQHLPDTWQTNGADGNDDGRTDPQNVYDSALTSAVHLCTSSSDRAVDFTDRDQLTDALFRYNPSDAYVTDALEHIDAYDQIGAATSGGPGSEAGQVAAQWALHQLGKPYIWGGTGPNGFDCSGLTQAAWAAAGVRIPRVTTDQYTAGTRVPIDELQPGDLLVYDTTDIGSPGPAPSHVTMYIGDGQMINAPSSGHVVRTEPVQSDFYSPRFMGAVRPG